mmetsp:Transcript_7666/g.22494  ORF Transcript_7666/g.22494 Transcript_7666/m.22494 type:complete len:228 (+) Transcript_7666:4053-4736(+)
MPRTRTRRATRRKTATVLATKERPQRLQMVHRKEAARREEVAPTHQDPRRKQNRRDREGRRRRGVRLLSRPKGGARKISTTSATIPTTHTRTIRTPPIPTTRAVVTTMALTTREAITTVATTITTITTLVAAAAATNPRCTSRDLRRLRHRISHTVTLTMTPTSSSTLTTVPTTVTATPAIRAHPTPLIHIPGLRIGRSSRSRRGMMMTRIRAAPRASGRKGTYRRQ